MGKKENPLAELKGLRASVFAEEKAKTDAILHGPDSLNPEEASDQQSEDEAAEEPEQAPIVVSPASASPPKAQSTAAPAAKPVFQITSGEFQPIQTFPPPSSDSTVEATSVPEPAQAPAPPPAADAPTSAAPPPQTNESSQGNGEIDDVMSLHPSPELREHLKRNLIGAQWTGADLVCELIRSQLHSGFPAIHFQEQILAHEGCYRTIERNPLESSLRIVSGQGTFNFQASNTHPDYFQWLDYFKKQSEANPEKSALQMCLFSLEHFLKSLDDFQANGWIKSIQGDRFVLNKSARTAG